MPRKILLQFSNAVPNLSTMKLFNKSSQVTCDSSVTQFSVKQTSVTDTTEASGLDSVCRYGDEGGLRDRLKITADKIVLR